METWELCINLSEYGKAGENLKKARDRKRNWRQTTRSRLLWNLGAAYRSLGKYGKAEEYQKKALSMVKRIGHKIGDKQGEARVM